MPRPFQSLTFDQFNDLFSQFQFARRIDSIHLHHTWLPDRSSYKGLATIEAMYRFHTATNGWSDIAQHITIDPNGTIWTGRNWNNPPVSVKGFNGNSECGPFMLEAIGNFDQSKDAFNGAQRDSVIEVIALIQEKFRLPPESLRFHNQMANAKTCPGNGIGYEVTLQAVRERRSSFPQRPEEDSSPTAISGATEPNIGSLGFPDEELLAEMACDSMHADEQSFYVSDDGYTQRAPGARGVTAARAFTAEDLAALRPYVVSMRQGRWDTGGLFNSTPGDVDALFFEHAQAAIEKLPDGKKLKLVLYAHGGLTSEQNGLELAQQHIAWWKLSANEGIYPIYFVWKTGLGETIGQLLRGVFGADARDPAAARAFITDPAIATVARRLGGEAIWSGMKRDAELAVLDNGAATYIASKMKVFCDRHQDRVELHAVGHSAGAVFHSHFIPKSTATGNPHFKSTSFMAPAVRVDTFIEQLTTSGALKPEVGKLAMFTMKKDWEQNDNCAEIYRQSLLYLIYHAFEANDPTPILGLEESIRADKRLTSIFGLSVAPTSGNDIIWAKSIATSGRGASQAIHHGDFSSDAATLNSILRRILNLNDTDPIHEFPVGGSRAIQSIWGPPDDLPELAAVNSPGRATTTAISPAPQPARTGTKKALCVGINGYASPNRLSGCVNDTHVWAEVLTRNGFATNLLLDEQATYDGITTALRSLVQASRPGDVLVFQYSGHGTTMPDETGRTVDGVEEAMVPIDFDISTPKLLMDFDVAAIFNTLPEGVNLTCFIDCCHSGTITRMLVGLAPEHITGVDERPRFILLTPDQVTAVRNYRAAFRATTRGITIGGPARMRDIVFSACQAQEVAWESNGQGDFTRHATSILAHGFSGITNQQFRDRVVEAFGPTPRQNPLLDCAPPAKARLLMMSVS
jgi:Caspase domain/N-acetylmuramoyl-L-alanine amidase